MQKKKKKKNVDMFGTWKFTPAVWDLDNTNSSHSKRLLLLTFFFLNKILLSNIIFCNCKYEMMIQLDVGSELERRIKWSWTFLTFNNWDLISWCDDLIWSMCWRGEVWNCSGDLKNEMGINEIKNMFSHCESAVTPWQYVLGLSVLKNCNCNRMKEWMMEIVLNE